jgi:hypothetical protein
MRQPYVAANHAVVPDDGISAENRRSGVYDDMVSDVRMALYAFNGIPVLVELEAFCPERYALIELHMVADGAGFPDDDACSVVYKEMIPNFSAGMYVNPRNPMGVFGHHPRNQRHGKLIQSVRQPVYSNGFKRRVREHDLFPGARGGVAFVRRYYVRFEAFRYPGEAADKFRSDRARATCFFTREYVPKHFAE